MKAVLLSVVFLATVVSAVADRSSAGGAVVDRDSTPIAAGATASGLYSFDMSRRALNKLIGGTDERDDVAWSPDGTWITSTDTADFLVDVIRPDGSGLRDVDSVSWSPMGSKVAYATEK